MKLEIELLEPERVHTKSNTITTATLAFILEAKYKLMQKFYEHIKTALEARAASITQDVILDTKQRTRLDRVAIEKIYNTRLGAWLQNEWRAYIVRGTHGIKTKAAQDTDRQSFIDTGDYFKSLQVRIAVRG